MIPMHPNKSCFTCTVIRFDFSITAWCTSRLHVVYNGPFQFRRPSFIREYIHLERIFGVPLFWKQIFLNNIFPFHVLLSKKMFPWHLRCWEKTSRSNWFSFCLFIGSESVPRKKIGSKYVISGKHYFLCLFVGSNHDIPKQLA